MRGRFEVGRRQNHMEPTIGPPSTCGDALLRRLGCARQRMTATEDYELGPIEKWRRYRVFPLRMVLHGIIMVFSTYLCIIYNSVHGSSSRALGDHFEQVFFPSDWQTYAGDSADFPEIPYRLYTREGFVESVCFALTTYFALESAGVSHFLISHSGEQRYPVDPPRARFTHFTHARSMYDLGAHWSPGTVTDEYPVNATWFFPVGNCSDAIDTSSLSQFFNELFVLEYDLPFLHWDVNTDDSFLDVHNCQSMVVHLEYNFKERGLFQVEASTQYKGPCEDTGNYYAYSLVVTSVVLVLLTATTHEALTLARFFKQILIMRQLRALSTIPVRSMKRAVSYGSVGDADSSMRSESRGGRPNTSTSGSAHEPLLHAPGLDGDPGVYDDVTWMDLTLAEKAEVFNFWFLLSTTSNVALIVFSGLALSGGMLFEDMDAMKFPLGLGCGLCWISAVQFISLFPAYYTIVLVVKNAAPSIASAMVGVFPLFVAFALFGMVQFGFANYRFSSWQRTFVEMFALVNGDVMRETFVHLQKQPSFFMSLVANLYQYLFVFLLMYVLLYTLVAINENAFFDARDQMHTRHMLSPRLRALMKRLR